MTRRWLVGVSCAVIAVALLAVRPRATPGPMLRDFESYWAAGSALNTQADPYGRAVWNAERTIAGVDPKRDELLPFVGPPSTLLVWSVFARLPYAAAAGLWLAFLAMALVALVSCTLRASEASFAPVSFFTALALAVAFAPITSGFALGQLALPGFLGAALVALCADRFLTAGAAAACLAFVQPNVAAGLVSQLGRNRATLAVALGALAAYLLGVITGGWAWPLTYARVVAAHGAAERFIAIQFSPASIAYGFGATPREALTVGVVVAALAIAAAILIGLDVANRFARFAAMSALAPFAVGFFHEHDLIVAYAAALWCALRARAAARTLALAGTLLVAIDWLGLAQRPTGIAQSCLLAVAAFATFLALGERIELRSASLIGLALALVFAGAAFLATRNPAPIWPDALVGFHAPAGATAATVWLAEQRASGLLAAIPTWALLRSLSLLGCALLAYAIYRHSTCCRTA